MNQDILLSKIVPNATDTTWSQAYTTLNVYMTLSIENTTSKTPVMTYGKEILEKLQREFFALDEKSLEQIKKAVGNVTSTIEKDYQYSIIIGAIVKNVLYIVTASKGKVVIKRGDKIGVIAEGEDNELIGFSGELKHNDIVIFETGDFSEKLTPEELSENLESNDVSQIAENITPLMHESSKGTEAAIIIQFKDLSGNLSKVGENNSLDIEEVSDEETSTKVESETNLKPQEAQQNDELDGDESNEDMGEKLWTNQATENNSIENIESANSDFVSPDEIERKRFSLPIPAFLNNRKIIIGTLIVLLLVVLSGGIYFQKTKSDAQKRAAEFEKVYTPIEKSYNEAVDASSLNKSQAVESFKKVLEDINTNLSNYNENSDEYKKIIELKNKINSQLTEIGGGSSVTNLKEIIKAGNDISTIDFVTLKGGDIIIASQKDKKIAIVEEGDVKKDFEIEDDIQFISSDDKFIYSLGKKGINQVDRGNSKAKIVNKENNGLAFEVFSSNIYILFDDDIKRMRSPGFLTASYFSDTTDFANTPLTMSISGSIYVLEKEGKIEKFTKGKKDEFAISGLAAPFGESSFIYTDGDFDNFYVMDVKNQRVVAFNNDGEFQKQYEGTFIKNSKSFAIDEKTKTGYVVSNNTLYRFDL